MIKKETKKNPLKNDYDKVVQLIESGKMIELAYNKTIQLLTDGIKYDFVAFFWSRKNSELKCVVSKGYKTKLNHGVMSEVGDYIPILSLTSANLQTLNSLFSVLNDANIKTIKNLLSEKISKTFSKMNFIMLNSCVSSNNSKNLLDYTGTEYNIPLDFYSKDLIYDFFIQNSFSCGNAESFHIINIETFELADELKVIENYVFEIYADIILDRNGSIPSLPLDNVVGFLTKKYKFMDYRYDELDQILNNDLEVNFTKIVIEDLKKFIKKTSGLIYNKSQKDVSDEVCKLESDLYALVSMFEKSKNPNIKSILLETFKELEDKPISWWALFYSPSDSIKDFWKSIFNEDTSPVLTWSIQSFELNQFELLSQLEFSQGMVVYLFGKNGTPYFISSKFSTFGGRQFVAMELLDFSNFKSNLYTTKKQNKMIDFYLENYDLSDDVRNTFLTVKEFPLAPWDK